MLDTSSLSDVSCKHFLSLFALSFPSLDSIQIDFGDLNFNGKSRELVDLGMPGRWHLSHKSDMKRL